MLPAKDVSRYQGAWQDTGEPIVLIKMSGGDDGLYMDSAATANYESAVKAGKAVGGYHFIGWTLGAVAEATYFLQAMSPVAENDVYALDVEALKPGVDPVAYVTEMVNTIHSKINVYPLLYINLATLRAYNWAPLLKFCGLWLADWNNDPAGTVPNVPVYVMQQYSDGPNYDHDEWFGTVEEFKAYGYHQAQVQTPPPSPTPTPEPTPAPVVPPPPAPAPAPPSTPPVETPPVSDPTPTPPPSNPQPTKPTQTQEVGNWFQRIWSRILRFLDIKV